MSAIVQDPAIALEGTAVRSRAGFLRQVLRERKAAVLGLGIIVFFVLLAIVSPVLAPYSTTAQTCQ